MIKVNGKLQKCNSGMTASNSDSSMKDLRNEGLCYLPDKEQPDEVPNEGKENLEWIGKKAVKDTRYNHVTSCTNKE